MRYTIFMNDNLILEKLEAIWPEVIGLVITQRNEKLNVCPINYQGVSTIYETPLTVTLGLDNKNLTLENILETKEFVYAYPSKDQLKDTIYCGTISGRNEDKLAKTNFAFSPSQKVATPHLVGAVLNYECTLMHHYNVGHFTIVIGEIVALHSSADKNVQKIYALGGSRYGIITDVEVLQDGR